MSGNKLKSLKGREILNSKGDPTVEVELKTDAGVFFASVPSGTSKGKYEALEKEAKVAIKNINEIIAPKLIGRDLTQQKEIDEFLIKLDGTKNKSRLGENSLLAVSIAVCRAGAKEKNLPLWKWISKISGEKPILPETSVLMTEGGLHAKGGGSIQEYMAVAPFEKTKIIYQRLQEIISQDEKIKIERGLEGAFVLPFENPKDVLDLILQAAGKEKIKIILDIAASHSSEKNTEYYLDLAKQYPILGLEDPFTQDDWKGWQKLNAKLKNSKIMVIGDDLTATNPERIKMAQNKKACNAVIIKPNQIGTVSETIESAKLAKSFGWKIIVSHRSGETMDSFIADLAVGIGANFIKSGAPFPKERMAKYNRLAKIEEELQK